MTPNTRRSLRVVLVATLLLGSRTRAGAQALELDSATVADLNAAFDKGTLTSEKLVQLSIARIDAYDRRGPGLRAIITLNPKALETARALDAERKAKGKRSPLHGIPIVLKDNFDTGMPSVGRDGRAHGTPRSRTTEVSSEFYNLLLTDKEPPRSARAVPPRSWLIGGSDLC